MLNGKIYFVNSNILYQIDMSASYSIIKFIIIGGNTSIIKKEDGFEFIFACSGLNGL